MVRQSLLVVDLRVWCAHFRAELAQKGWTGDPEHTHRLNTITVLWNCCGEVWHNYLNIALEIAVNSSFACGQTRRSRGSLSPPPTKAVSPLYLVFTQISISHHNFLMVHIRTTRPNRPPAWRQEMIDSHSVRLACSSSTRSSTSTAGLQNRKSSAELVLMPLWVLVSQLAHPTPSMSHGLSTWDPTSHQSSKP